MGRSSLRLGTVLALLVALVLIAPAGPASATRTRANTDAFSFSGTYAFPDHYLCINYSGKATVNYNAVRYGPTSGSPAYYDYWLKGIKLSSTSVTYRVVRYDSVSHACTTTGVKWKRLEASQHWSGYSCSFNPSISVQYPFGAGVSFWPSCGKRKQATYRSTYDRANGLAGPAQTQGTSNDQTFANNHVAYQPTYKAAPAKGACYGVWVGMHWYVGSADNQRNFGAHRLCLTPQW
ncbi:hypothetical protein GCM10009798_25230 [Nocardioides panacihumi]|uniref:Uncharacterized protein n=1 Tax=Nocardioides panacihumi TaxID=400774 RepID=A0ABN2R5Q0_9ACTN